MIRIHEIGSILRGDFTTRCHICNECGLAWDHEFVSMMLTNATNAKAFGTGTTKDTTFRHAFVFGHTISIFTTGRYTQSTGPLINGE